MHKMVRCFNEIWNIFPVSFPELDDNNLIISRGAEGKLGVKVPWGMTGIRREKRNRGSLGKNGAPGMMGMKEDKDHEGSRGSSGPPGIKGVKRK